MGSMRHGVLFILIVLALSLQAMLGGLGGIAPLCLGGGHEHGPAEVETESCEAACEHGVAARADDGHDHHCGCTDVRIALVDLLTTAREDAGSLRAPATGGWTALMPAAPGWPVATVVCGTRQPDDRGGGGGLRAVRCARLLL